MDSAGTVEGLFIGEIKSPWADKPPSAIAKLPVDGPQFLASHGFEHDRQADLTVHGGADKAVHHYPADHYEAWQAEGMMEDGTPPAAFGENISTLGLLEANLCIGDIFRLGAAVVQISQGRQPCWKLDAHTGRDNMAYLFRKTLRTGWYYRVLETGMVGVGDPVQLVERPQPDWTVAKVTAERLTKSKTHAAILSELPELALDWRQTFATLRHA